MCVMVCFSWENNREFFLGREGESLGLVSVFVAMEPDKSVDA